MRRVLFLSLLAVGCAGSAHGDLFADGSDSGIYQEDALSSDGRVGVSTDGGADADSEIDLPDSAGGEGGTGGAETGGAGGADTGGAGGTLTGGGGTGGTGGTAVLPDIPILFGSVSAGRHFTCAIRLDNSELEVIRKISGLFHVEHKDFIDAKIKIKKEFDLDTAGL